ncbi:FUSC family protein [Curtobacterium sp. RRHDQ10]|uniref:FUSC family protein n=1 Tax=Curtobacterium phyllosphaerae TaxID=3413379 RepID=UPI003BF1807D
MQLGQVTTAGRQVWRWSRTSGTQPRVVLAVKAAVAAVVAFVLARYMPGVAADYPYYAPLGAVVAMQSTLLSSVRSGVQTLVGIAIGVGIAGVTMWLGDPGFVAVGIAVGIGVLIGGFRILGEGGSWAPTAAVLVLLVGGSHAEGYSFGYVLQMGVGVVVGLLVNFVAFPPLHFWNAERRINETNVVLAQHLDALADALAGDAETDTDVWVQRQHRLDREMAEVRERLSAAEESRRGNPRAIRGRNRRRLLADAARFRALERAAWYTTDLTEIVGRSGPASGQLGRIGAAFADRLAAAIRAVARVVQGDGSAELDDEAVAAIRVVESAMDGGGASDGMDGNRPSDVTLTSASTVALWGIVESERRATT